jgi:hypothetical protein
VIETEEMRMADLFKREPPHVEQVARIGSFIVERTHIPNAPNIFLAFLCLWANSLDATSERIILSRFRNHSWTQEFVARNAVIWLRNRELQQVKYPPAPEYQLREERRYNAVSMAVRDLIQTYPDLALEGFSYLAPCAIPTPTPGRSSLRVNALDAHGGVGMRAEITPGRMASGSSACLASV